jgi:hypothetical protein
MNIYFNELVLDHGFAISAQPRHQRLVSGSEISLCSGYELFRSLNHKGQIIKCWQCGCVADRWVLTLGRNDRKSKPVLNLYATHTFTTRKGRQISHLVLMTRDHIIPKSLGGKDVVENLRAGCENCNSQRGSDMEEEDLRFMRDHPHLICPERLAKAQETRRKHEERLAEQQRNKLARAV